MTCRTRLMVAAVAVVLVAPVLLPDAEPASATGAAGAVAVVTRTLPFAFTTAPFRTSLVARGGTPPYSWKLSGGSLPRGVTLARNGVLSGTPPAVGTATFRVTVTDASRPAGTSSRTLALTVTGPTLEAGQVMHAGAHLTSPGGQFKLKMQPDGNLVEYSQGTPLWSSNTDGDTGDWVTMQTDGNLVICSATGRPVWASNTGGRSPDGYFLAMQDDSNVVIYAATGGPLWASSTVPPSHLSVGQVLQPGWFLRSANGQYSLDLQSSDGNLVVYQGGTAIWASSTSGHAGDYLIMQGDGNLVVYGGAQALWASNTAGSGSNNSVDMQSDGNLVVYTSAGTPVWASKSSTPADAAISWAQGYLGTNKYNGECLQFVHDAYSHAGINIGAVGNTAGAAQYWSQDPAGYAEHAGNTSPPVGALVFWGASDVGGYNNPYGHVGIYVGDAGGYGDAVISTWSWPEPESQPNVHYFSLSGRNAAGYPYLGWMIPPTAQS